MKKLVLVCGLFLVLFSLGCSKKAPDEKASRILFQMPQKMGNTSQSGTSCFAVNIKADDLLSSDKSICDPSYGDYAGLAPAGSEIEIETSSGKGRVIELFFIQSDSGCTSNFDFSKGLGKTFGSNRVHRIGKVEGIDLAPGDQKVEIEIQWSDKDNSLTALYDFPKTCEKNNRPRNSQVHLVQGSIHGASPEVQYHIRVRDQKIKRQNNSWDTTLKPPHLGAINE